MKKLVLAGFIAATIGVALPAAARTHVDFIVNVGPPALRYEPVPMSRAGYRWVPGHWEWRHGKHYWVRGQYLRHRFAQGYQPARRVEHGRHWRYVAPVWHPRDRDGDGVPNRYDRRPDKPYYR